MAKYITRLVKTASSYLTNNGGDIDPSVLEAGEIILEAPKSSGILFNYTGWASGQVSQAQVYLFTQGGGSPNSICLLYYVSNFGSQTKRRETKVTPAGASLTGYWYGLRQTAEKALDTGTYATHFSNYTLKFQKTSGGTTYLYVQRLGVFDSISYPSPGYAGDGTEASPYRTRLNLSSDEARLDDGLRALVDVLVNTITYYRNYGSQTVVGTQDVTSKYDGSSQSVTPSVTTPTRAGYTFAGWNTSADGTGTAYAPGAPISVSVHDVSLYAQWEKTPVYTVVLDGPGTENLESKSMTCTYGVTYQLPSVAEMSTPTGYGTPCNWSDGTNTYPAGSTFSNLTNVDGAVINMTTEWTANTYTVYFDANGGTGSSMTPQAFVYGEPQNLSENLYSPQTGYMFVGWNTEADGSGTAYADEENVSNLTAVNNGAVTLYAQWGDASETFTIHFDKNSASATGEIQDIERTSGSSATLPSSGFSLTGYSISAWNTRPDGSGVSYSPGDNVTDVTGDGTGSTVALYAQWAGVSYSVTFNANGGEGTAMPAQDFTYGVQQPLSSNTYTKEGESFAGWAESASGSVKYADGQTVLNLTTTSGGTVALYAVWIPPTITVSFDPNGGSGTISNQVISSISDSLKSNSFTAPDYFVAAGGWNTKMDGSGTSYAAGTSGADALLTAYPNGGSVTLYAMWQRVEITVSFDKNRPSASGTMGSQVFYSGIQQGLSANKFTDTGAYVTGWNTASNGSGTSYSEEEEVTFPATSPASVTLYAMWSPWSLTVSFVGADETPMTVQYGNGLTLPSAPTTSGATFDEWKYGESGYQAGETISASDLWSGINADGQTVYVTAQWNYYTYSVSFSANGGTGSAMPSQSFTYGQAEALDANSYQREGYDFTGWNTEADGSGTSFADKALVKNLTATNGETVALYAQWAKSSSIPQYEAYVIPQAPGAAVEEFSSAQDEEGTPLGEEITLAELPNQSVSVTYDGNTYEIHLRSFRNVMYADVSVNGYVVSLGVKCVLGAWLIPNMADAPYDAGNMRFESEGDDYPYYPDFMRTSRLMFYRAARLKEVM